jgi:DNA replication licensing factor MCM3
MLFSNLDLEGGEDEEAETPVYEKYDALLHGNSRKKTDKIVSGQFIKKYVHIAKVSSSRCSFLELHSHA